MKLFDVVIIVALLSVAAYALAIYFTTGRDAPVALIMALLAGFYLDQCVDRR